MADSNTRSTTCAKCGKTDNLKRCAKCQTTQYCSRECQKEDWKEHKRTCSGDAGARTTSGSSNTTERTPSTGTRANTKGLSVTIEKPFTALQEKKWLYDRPENDVYKLLIDAHRLRLDDDHNFSGTSDSIYGGAPNGYDAFSRFLRKAENSSGLLPPWWLQEKAAECARQGQQPGWSDLNRKIGKSDIIDRYGDAEMPM